MSRMKPFQRLRVRSSLAALAVAGWLSPFSITGAATLAQYTFTDEAAEPALTSSSLVASAFGVNVSVAGYDDLSTAEIRMLGWDKGSRATTGGGHLHVDDVLAEGIATAGVAQSAIRVRVATYNVEHGLGEPGLDPPGSAQYNAVKAVLQRIDADIIGFQEMMPAHFDHWYMLAAELDYPYVAVGDTGEFDSMRQGYFSRHPIASTYNVTSPPGAKELTRAPFRAVFDIPDATQPLVIWNMHHKAMGDSASRFRRAVEAIRIVQDIDAYRTANPAHDAFLFMGDLNEGATSGQPVQFNSLPSGLPSSYQLGADIAFPVPYSLFPDDRYRNAGGGMTVLEAYRTGTTDNRCYSGSRLSHIFLSDALYGSPMGPPQGEIYFSGSDDDSGLPKSGGPLPSGTSWNASDHLLIFADFYLAATPPDDGIPPSWRIQYFGHPEPRDDGDCRAEDDPDGNGMTNWEEYVAGTDPLNYTSTLRLDILALPDGEPGLRFDTVTGRLYSIEYREGFGAGSEWMEVEDFPEAPGTGAEITHGVTATHGPPRFYRLRVRLAP